MLKKYFIKKFLKELDNIKYGILNLTTPDDKKYSFFGSNDLEVNVEIKNWRFLSNIAAKGDIGFAISYRDNLFDVDNLVNLCLLILKNDYILDKYIYGNNISNILAQILYYLRSNTIKGSKKNIYAHYDLGNDFYSLWLDPTMTYSSAIFKYDGEPLVQAQYNKYDRIIEKLNSKSGSILEIGCGWGGFADRAMQNYDFNIKAITISDKQYYFAKNRLQNKANIALEDYRYQKGKYDNIVSIEMFEAVGEKYWKSYFNNVKASLKNKGKAIIQTITIDDKYFQRYRKTGDIIRTFIFPGGMLPSFTRLKYEVERSGLKVTDNFKFGKDYATTLNLWLNSFEDNLSKVKNLNFDEEFIRMWRMYLSICIASFTVGRTNVLQLELEHA